MTEPVDTHRAPKTGARPAVWLAGLAGSLLLAACDRLPLPLPPDDPNPRPNAAGLVPLPCAEAGPLRPVNPSYCRRGRQFVTPAARAVLLAAADAFARSHDGRPVRYMEASWGSGVRPMPPHRSHGDGREIDIAFFYQDRQGRPLNRTPTSNGYGAFEPPRRESERLCLGVTGDHAAPDPPADRSWRLDESATRDLIRILLSHRQTRRIFIEPHLKSRLGLSHEDRVRFAGCQVARHDDHIHADFF